MSCTLCASLVFTGAAVPIIVSHALQNLVLAVGAMLALSLPVLCGAIPLWTAVMLHEGSTLLVALNSLRLLYAKDKIDKDRRPSGEAPAMQPAVALAS